jgi:hypothetical protein
MADDSAVELYPPARRAPADRVYLIDNGHIVEALDSQAVRDRPEVLHRHLGV